MIFLLNIYNNRSYIGFDLCHSTNDRDLKHPKAENTTL